MYRDYKININKDNELFAYISDVSSKANNLYNASLFRQRQVLTAVYKQAEGIALTKNEQDVMDEVEKVLIHVPDKYERPSKDNWALSYYFMDTMLKITNNPDYFCDGLPRQCAQQIIKNSCKDMKAFRHALGAFREKPECFSGRPKLPDYHKKGGFCTFYFTNQQCLIKENRLQFPLTSLTLDIGTYIQSDWRLKQVTVVPYYDIFTVHIICDDGKTGKSAPEVSKNICAVDLGVNNFAAITNNIGLPCCVI